MNGKTITRDKILIGLFLDLAQRQGWTADRAAQIVGRTGSWGSLLFRGKIKSLQKSTRVNVRRLLEQYLFDRGKTNERTASRADL